MSSIHFAYSSVFCGETLHIQFCKNRSVPKRSNVRRRPVDYILRGAWPLAELEPSVPANYAQIFARNLSIAIGEFSLREIGRRAGLSGQTIQKLEDGESWPDTVSVAKLEYAFKSLLWPSDQERQLIFREVRPIVVRSDSVAVRENQRRELERIISVVEDMKTSFLRTYPEETL